MKTTVYQITSGSHKGYYVVKTTYKTPKSVWVRGLEPLDFDKLFVGWSQKGKVRSSVRIAYPEFMVFEKYLHPIGSINIAKCFTDPDGMDKECGPNGFQLLKKYYGKTRKQIEKLTTEYKTPPNLVKKINFY